MSHFVPHMEILPTEQRNLWPLLSPISHQGFVLYGGTAIALRLGHRQSVDFDFFSTAPLDKPTLLDSCSFLRQATILQDTPDTYTALVSQQGAATVVKLSFFGNIGFGRVGTPEWTDDNTVLVAALVDLLATKVKVILQRIEAKDYQDIATIIRSGINLADGLAAARLLYGTSFQYSESLKAMVYFEGGDLDTLTSDTKRTLIEAVQQIQTIPNAQLAATTLGE